MPQSEGAQGGGKPRPYKTRRYVPISCMVGATLAVALYIPALRLLAAFAIALPIVMFGRHYLFHGVASIADIVPLNCIANFSAAS